MRTNFLQAAHSDNPAVLRNAAREIEVEISRTSELLDDRQKVRHQVVLGLFGDMSSIRRWMDDTQSLEFELSIWRARKEIFDRRLSGGSISGT